MNLREYQNKKELIKADKYNGEVIEGENMTDIIGYAPLNLTIEDMISAGYVAQMNLLSRIIHDIESEEQLAVFEKYVVPFYRRTGIDFLDAYNEVRQKVSRISTNISSTIDKVNAEKGKKQDNKKQNSDEVKNVSNDDK